MYITPFTRTTVLLLLGALQDKPVVIDGQVAVRPILRVTGTFDHRLIDGFQAGKFGATFKEIMEDPAAKLA